jgi:potassium efflux system protein
VLKDKAVRKDATQEVPILADPEGIDVLALGVQVHRLISMAAVFVVVVGLWFVWSDVLPALGIFDKINLWEHSVTAVETVTNPDGTVRTVESTRMEPVTVAGLVFSIVVFAMMFVAARNLPGLLEIAVLQRLNLDSGLRYAIASVARYAIFIVGIIIGFRLLGVGWRSVQWLAAAVSVGLGFGLQEIFGNFVSGLILLFERPIRLGDLVTVGQTTGTVSQIRIRATTITDFDGKDYVVPNKQLITGDLVNWTLTDTITRITYPVGVAYGSDTEKVRRILIGVAASHPLVLKEPEPFVIFNGFGDYSLNFKLMAYVGALSHRVQVINEVNDGIARAFSREGIEIPFPIYSVNLQKGAPGVDVEKPDIPGTTPR